MTNIPDLTTPSPEISMSMSSMSTASASASTATAVQPPEHEMQTPNDNRNQDIAQQWYNNKSSNNHDLFVGPVRRKRMPAGRHAVMVSTPAKAEAQLQQGEARKQ